MAGNDLIFRQPLAGGPPNVLVFGEPETPSSGAAYAVGRIPLPAFMVGGAVRVTAPPKATAAGRIPLPAFMVAGSVRYDSAAQRPLIGAVVSRWQQAQNIEAPTLARHQVAATARVGRVSRWQRAEPRSAGTAVAWQEAKQSRAAVSLRHQAAAELGSVNGVRWQEAARVLGAASLRWQAARAVGSGVGLRWQEAIRMRQAAAVRWQAAEMLLRPHVEAFGAARQIERGWVSRWQAAMWPQPGRSPTPPGSDPCYVPSTQLVFREPQRHTSALIFICERHGLPPGTGETVVVPILEVYSVENSIALSRVDGGDIIDAKGFAMSLDADSWTWQWSATIPASALPLVTADGNGDPAEVIANVNGVPYRLTAESYRRDRSFGKSEVRVQGRGRAAMLDVPYAPELNFAASAPRSAAQLMALAMTINGVSNGWAIDFGITDWLVPGGTWAFQGTPIAAVLDIAAAAGAIVQPHATDATLRILPRYPAAPWNWHTLTPDYVLPADAIAVEGVEWITRPDYNRVFLFGSTDPSFRGQVTRSGTQGDSVAPQVAHALMTHADAAAQRGIAELSNTGRQASVSLRMQVLPETGLILPGSLVSYDGGDAVRLGLVRGMQLDWSRPTLRQVLSLETHVEA
ncbi:hypothetical protein [Variovorax sp. CY25R-8]|uniref:hypothetical protein n=1 Tax=Variovorax sp. CY25R-8 TaxID=2855501 RepID=UPI0021BB71F9|nr:hypothetical protein [Variovorax sp. CY25R-8]MCT8174390.1 hypothetical protein [Variovorax sp. CY25R-8]